MPGWKARCVMTADEFAAEIYRQQRRAQRGRARRRIALAVVVAVLLVALKGSGVEIVAAGETS